MLENPETHDNGESVTRSPTPVLDSSIILSHLLNISRTHLMAHPEIDIGTTEEAFFSAIRHRAGGLPVAYITGIREFWGLQFRVTPAVLIPKADTEILVERASAIIGTKALSVLDVCTGSGCIAIALKHDFPGISMTATDISPEALEVAEFNAKNLLGGGIRFIQGDLRDGLPRAQEKSPVQTAGANSADKGYDLIVSNPPYVPAKTAQELLSDGRGEPLLALDGGEDGLDLVRALAIQARKRLTPGGTLLVETGEYNAKDAAAYLKDIGFTDIIVHTDLEGQDRVVEGISK